MRFGELRDALVRTYDDIGSNHTLQMAAALSYYFVMALFPALIVLSAIVAYLPVPDLFEKAIELMGRYVPNDSMGLVRQILHDVVTPNRGTLLSVGLLGTFWAASGGFAAGIENLDISCGAGGRRPFLETMPLALRFNLLCWALLPPSLSLMCVGAG